MTRYERFRVAKQSGRYSFHELSKMVDFSTKKKLTSKEYNFLVGRLTLLKSDFLVSPSGKYYTIGGSKGNRFIVKVKGRPNKVYGVYEF